MKKILILLLCLGNPLSAQQDPVLALRDASAQIEAATAALAVSDEASETRITALSGAIISLEGGLASLRLALLASKAVEAEKLAEMSESRSDLGRLLATIGALQNTPSALTILHPDGATASARAAIILAAITPALQAESEKLRAELATISALHDVHDAALGNMQSALQTLQEARTALTVAIRSQTPPPSATTQALADLAQLAQASIDLNTLAAQLSSSLPEGTVFPETRNLRGRLQLPLVGTLSRPFNAPNDAGIRQPGIVVTAPPLSLVIAPQAGIVRFSGDFLEYGQVVILEPSPNQLQIYAGFGQVYVKAGEVLESGATMGLLGGEMPDSAEFLAENGSENDMGAESLYIEIRENGMPVDPETWFAIN